ncbi:MAG: hypothetical protein IJT07_00240 [Oscillospiraceae bacterium]|nr:hypothetical protein [Oscillospiraceae bacterium]
MNLRRTFCLLLSLLVLLCACGAPTEPPAEQAPTVIVASGEQDAMPAPELLATRAFQKHFYKLPGTLTAIWDVCTDAKYVYLLGVDEDNDETAQLWRMGLDGSGETKLYSFAEIQTETAWRYHSRLLPQPGGGVCVQETEGAEFYVFPEGVTAESAGPDRWDYYDHTDVVTRLYRFTDGAAPTVTTLYSGKEPPVDLAFVGDKLALCVDKTIRIIAPDGTLLAAHTGDRSIYDFAATDDALYAVAASDNGENASVFRVTLADATLGDALDGISAPFYGSVGTLDGGIVAEQSGDLFLYQPTTKSVQKLVDWLDYGVNPFEIAKSYASESAAIAVRMDGDAASLVVLTPSNTTVLPTGTLTVAVLYPDGEIVDAVLAFNSSGKDRVRLVDYSEYDFFAQNAQARLTEDLASNRCPDLVYSGVWDLPADRLAEGKLADLTPFLATDADKIGEQLLPSCLSLLAKNGKIYTIAPYFYLRTMIGRESVVGSDLLTIGTTARLAATLPDGGSIGDFYLTRDTVFSEQLACTTGYLRQGGGYRFGSQVFYDVLAYAKLFPAEIDWNRFGAADYSGWARVRQGSQLVIADSYTEFASLAVALHSVGSDGVLCGMPAVPGGHAMLFPTTVGMTTACSDRDAAWRFLRTMLLADYQQKQLERGSAYGFPTNETALEAVGTQALESNDTLVLSSGDLTVEVSCRPTQREYDAILAAIRATVSRENADGTLLEVIAPSAQRYFTGELDAPRTAQDAQTAWDAIAAAPN